MSTTLAAIRDQIILDAKIEGHPAFTTLRLNRIINLAQRHVQTQLCELGIKKWEVVQDVSGGLSAGAFMSGTNNVKKVPINAAYFANMIESPKSISFIETDNSSTYSIAYEIDPQFFREQLNNTFLSPTLAKPVFTRLANYIWLAPSTITSAKAHYYKMLSDLDDTTRTITGATHSNGSVTISSTAHGLSIGDEIVISGVTGMTDLNGTRIVSNVVSADSFAVFLTTAQSYSANGTAVKVCTLPVEFEEYLIKKAVIDIRASLGLLQNKEEQTSSLNEQINNNYEKFTSKIDMLNINKQVDGVEGL